MMPETDPPTPIPSAASRPRLERPRDERLVSGVCAALARHLGVDVTIVRVLTVVVACFGGAGVLAYLIGLVFIPEEGTDQPIVRTGKLDDDDRTPLIIGGLALLAIVTGAGPLPWGGWDGGGWLIVLVIAGALVWYALRHDRATDEVSAAVATPVADEPTTEMRAGDTLVSEPAPAPKPKRPRGRGRLVTGIVLLVIGGLGLLASAADLDLAWDTAIALGVIVLGAAAIAAAPFGGARGLLLVGFLAAAIGGFGAAADVDLQGGWGDRTERPVLASEIPHRYHLAAGHLLLDLRELRLAQGTTIVRARVGLGDLEVRVPRGVTVVGHASAGIGEVESFGRHEDGGEPDVTRQVEGSPVKRLIVEARTGMGHVQITRGQEGR